MLLHPLDCPEFEYSDHPQKGQVLRASLREALKAIRDSRSVDLLADTRPLHRRLFHDFCPLGFEYFAGHYRGEDFRCLKHYGVQISSDPRVGIEPHRVPGKMARFGAEIRSGMVGIDSVARLPDSQVRPAEKLANAVAFASRIFVDFLTVHPYANGNGHTARLLLTGLLMRYGYLLRGFPVDPRPPDPPYSELIRRYRDGQTELLEQYLLRCLK